MFTIRVMRAHAGGTFSVEYEGPSDGNRVQTRMMVERLQDSFDDEGEPLRAYMVRKGLVIEAAYCLQSARG